MSSLPRYIVMTAQVPASKGRYGHAALVELDGSGVYPKMISERAKGVKRVVVVTTSIYVAKAFLTANGVSLPSEGDRVSLSVQFNF